MKGEYIAEVEQSLALVAVNLEGAACRDALASDADRSVFWAHERACLFVEKKDFGAVLYFHVLVDLLWSRHLDLQLRDLVSRAGLTHAQLWLSEDRACHLARSSLHACACLRFLLGALRGGLRLELRNPLLQLRNLQITLLPLWSHKALAVLLFVVSRATHIDRSPHRYVVPPALDDDPNIARSHRLRESCFNLGVGVGHIGCEHLITVNHSPCRAVQARRHLVCCDSLVVRATVAALSAHTTNRLGGTQIHLPPLPLRICPRTPRLH